MLSNNNQPTNQPHKLFAFISLNRKKILHSNFKTASKSLTLVVRYTDIPVIFFIYRDIGLPVISFTLKCRRVNLAWGLKGLTKQ